MLIRHRTDGTFDCITQEQHALQSGLLAAAWAPTQLPGHWQMAIGLHDTPWRDADRLPVFNPDTGLPHDFVDIPKQDKFALYRSGLDDLEAAHPYAAYMISRHYSNFSGTQDAETLTVPEERRRSRLRDLFSAEELAGEDEALAWIQYFDAFSLYACLTGPGVVPNSIPGWLKFPALAPDGTRCEVRWEDSTTLRVDPWPFHETPHLGLFSRRLIRRFETPDKLAQAWSAASWTPVELRLVSA